MKAVSPGEGGAGCKLLRSTLALLECPSDLGCLATCEHEVALRAASLRRACMEVPFTTGLLLSLRQAEARARGGRTTPQ